MAAPTEDSTEETDPNVMWAQLLSFHEAGFLIGLGCQSQKAKQEGMQCVSMPLTK